MSVSIEWNHAAISSFTIYYYYCYYCCCCCGCYSRREFFRLISICYFLNTNYFSPALSILAFLSLFLVCPRWICLFGFRTPRSSKWQAKQHHIENSRQWLRSEWKRWSDGGSDCLAKKHLHSLYFEMSANEEAAEKEREWEERMSFTFAKYIRIKCAPRLKA